MILLFNYPSSSNRWICEDRHETNEAFFLRFVKVSKSLPLSEPTFCAPISKPTTPGSWGSLSRPFCGSLTPHTGIIIRGSGGITGNGDDCFLVCLVCESLVGEDEPYSVRVEHSRIVSCFQSGVDRSPIQPTWAVRYNGPSPCWGWLMLGINNNNNPCLASIRQESLRFRWSRFRVYLNDMIDFCIWNNP